MENNESRKLRKLLIQEYEQFCDFAERVDKQIFDLRIKNISERLGYFKHITTIIVAVIGFIIVMLGNDKGISEYLIISLITNLILIVLLISHIREVLDRDAVGLNEEHQKYLKLIEIKKDLLKKYIEKPEINKKDVKNYQKEISQSPGLIDLQDEIKRREEEKENLKNKLNYFGEFIVFLFLFGVAFLVMSFLNNKLPFLVIGLIIAGIFVLSFIDLSRLLTNCLNEIIHFIKKIFKK